MKEDEVKEKEEQADPAKTSEKSKKERKIRTTDPNVSFIKYNGVCYLLPKYWKITKEGKIKESILLIPRMKPPIPMQLSIKVCNTCV